MSFNLCINHSCDLLINNNTTKLQTRYIKKKSNNSNIWKQIYTSWYRGKCNYSNNYRYYHFKAVQTSPSICWSHLPLDLPILVWNESPYCRHTLIKHWGYNTMSFPSQIPCSYHQPHPKQPTCNFQITKLACKQTINTNDGEVRYLYILIVHVISRSIMSTEFATSPNSRAAVNDMTEYLQHVVYSYCG